MVLTPPIRELPGDACIPGKPLAPRMEARNALHAMRATTPKDSVDNRSPADYLCLLSYLSHSTRDYVGSC